MTPRPSSILVSTYDHHFLLTGLYLPNHVVFTKPLTGATTDTPDTWTRLSGDEGFARVLTMIAEERMPSPFRKHAAGTPKSPDLETWVFRPSADLHGRLDTWFSGEPSATSATPYRVLLHRSPGHFGTRAIQPVWEAAYEVVEGNMYPIRRKPLGSIALRAGVLVLEGAVAAHREQPSTLGEYVDGLGHPYCHVRAGAGG
ncbi:hypothetical protein PHYC_02014 [Phycisphaerales bacterium]|nr:hypothetical protein PHYC_02014 [Phycisphaerales bacterium]